MDKRPKRTRIYDVACKVVLYQSFKCAISLLCVICRRYCNMCVICMSYPNNIVAMSYMCNIHAITVLYACVISSSYPCDIVSMLYGCCICAIYMQYVLSIVLTMRYPHVIRRCHVREIISTRFAKSPREGCPIRSLLRRMRLFRRPHRHDALLLFNNTRACKLRVKPLLTLRPAPRPPHHHLLRSSPQESLRASGWVKTLRQPRRKFEFPIGQRRRLHACMMGETSSSLPPYDFLIVQLQRYLCNIHVITVHYCPSFFTGFVS
jgi:hypothetical protein